MTNGLRWAVGSGRVLLAAGILLVATPHAIRAQDARIADLTVDDRALPVRLVGYGLVVGLDGTGDRAAKGGGMTVTSVANMLRRLGIDVPAQTIGTRNAAAVLVTAEVSPYLRAGGKFEVHVSSLGDARSLRGGVLFMTPLVADAGQSPVATAQGAVLTSDVSAGGSGGTVFRPASGGGAGAANVARIPMGGLIEGDLPRPAFTQIARLVLKTPDLGTAARIASAINKEAGDGSAKVEDPGSVALTLKGDDAAKADLLAKIRELKIRPDRAARLIIDARAGTVVAGGDITVGDAVVSHAGTTLSVGLAPDAAPPPVAGDTTTAAPAVVPGDIRVATGTPAARIVAALHAVQTPPADIAAIFAALREAGAISAEVVVR